MFKMGCSMARRILGPGQSAPGDNHEQTATCFSGATSPSSSQADGAKKRGNEHSTAMAGSGPSNSANKPGQPSSELDDFTKLEADPRLPLNVRQIFKITKSWKAIARTMSKTGTAMFLNLFEQNQDLFYLFGRFKNLTGKDLHESMELREHAATVMATLDTSINSLNDYDNFVTYLHSIGRLHRKVVGFKREYFWKIEQPFMKAVKQTLDERCNETIEEIYKIAIKLIIETIADGYGQDGPNVASGQPGDDSSRSAQGGNGNGNGGATRDSNNPNEPGNCPAATFKGSGGGGGADGNGSRARDGRQNQQTSECISASTFTERVSRNSSHNNNNNNCDECTKGASGKTMGLFHYSEARRTLTKIVILTRSVWQLRSRHNNKQCRSQSRHSQPTRPFESNELADMDEDQNERDAELISATCKLMNTTANLIDSCASHAQLDDDDNNQDKGGQPRAQLAQKLLGWRALLVNLNCALINGENGRFGELDRGWPDRRQASLSLSSNKDQQKSVCVEGSREQRGESSDNLGDKQLGSSELENRNWNGASTMSVDKLALCPMRQRDGTKATTTTTTTSKPTSVRSARAASDQVCCSNGTKETSPNKTRTIKRNMNHLTGATAEGDQFNDDDGGLARQVKGSSMQIGMQTEKLKHETTTTRTATSTGRDDEKHGLVEIANQHEHSIRAYTATNANDERPSRSIDLFGPQATNLPIAKQTKKQTEKKKKKKKQQLEPTTEYYQELSSQSNRIAFSSCANRPMLGQGCLVQDQAFGPNTVGDESRRDNGNLYRRVSRDSTSPGQPTRGINELREAGGSIKCQTTIEPNVAAPAVDIMQDQDRVAAKSNSTDRLSLSMSSSSNEGVCDHHHHHHHLTQLRSKPLMGQILAETNHHGYRPNDGGECDHISNSASATAAHSQTTNERHDGCGGGKLLPDSRTVALLHKGERSVQKLLHDIELQRLAIRPDEADSGDLIEFIKVIILINKLILASASSSIRTTTDTPNGLPYTTFCKTTLAN